MLREGNIGASKLDLEKDGFALEKDEFGTSIHDDKTSSFEESFLVSSPRLMLIAWLSVAVGMRKAAAAADLTTASAPAVAAQKGTTGLSRGGGRGDSRSGCRGERGVLGRFHGEWFSAEQLQEVLGLVDSKLSMVNQRIQELKNNNKNNKKKETEEEEEEVIQWSSDGPPQQFWGPIPTTSVMMIYA